MKSDFLLAITQLSAEKNLPKDVVLTAVEAALVSAYKKDTFTVNQEISVKINPNTGQVEVWAKKTVVDAPSDTRTEISLKEARKVKPDAQIDDSLMIESTPHNAGRIAAQTAKQVILQRLHEAEHSAIFEEFNDREGEVITGLVQRVEPGQIFIDLGRTEAILPASEQVRNERYRIGQRLKVAILQVMRTPRGPRVVLSRSHPDLLRQLFELEVPEVFNGIVEVTSIAREAGYRSKVAVTALQEGIDPVGCCVGLRGIRIQNIVNELNGEKIDVVMWDTDSSVLIANALSPANILSVELNAETQVATVVVPDRQLSLAIGKEGQNARLAAKLSGWRIDIKSASLAEAEEVAESKLTEEEQEETVTEEKEETDTTEIPVELEPTPDTAEVSESKDAKPLPTPEETEPPPQVLFEPPKKEKPQLRFAEDILRPQLVKPSSKVKKKKRKSTYGKEKAEDGIKIKKTRRGANETIEEEDDEGYEQDVTAEVDEVKNYEQD